MRRRNDTTEFLKECMADALLKLLKQKKIEDITITEITEMADVSRITYYRHFTSKEDMLYFKGRLIGERWYSNLTEEQIQDKKLLSLSFFTLMDSIRDTLLTLYHANLYHIVLLSIYNTMRDIKDSSVENAYFSSFLSFGMAGILTEWFNRNCKETPEKLSELTLKNLVL